MEIKEIDLNKVKNDELLDIYNKVKETIDFFENEIKTNEVESK